MLRSDAAAGVLAGVGTMLGGVLAALHGWFLNVLGLRRRAQEWEAVERPRPEAAARSGTLAIDTVRLTSVDEALEQADLRIAQRKAAIGRHGDTSVFFIPMEIVGILAVIGGSC